MVLGVHVPSLLVGSAVAGGCFLFVHQQLSHRSRLSKKWPVAEWAEGEFRAKWNDLRQAVKADEGKSQLQPPSLTKEWNKGVSYIQEVVEKSVK